MVPLSPSIAGVLVIPTSGEIGPPPPTSAAGMVVTPAAGLVKLTDQSGPLAKPSESKLTHRGSSTLLTLASTRSREPDGIALQAIGPSLMKMAGRGVAHLLQFHQLRSSMFWPAGSPRGLQSGHGEREQRLAQRCSD